MLPQENRLRKNHEILRVYRKGSYGGGGPLSVKAAPSRLPVTRAAIVVPKKVDKRAVVRNRNRRRIVEILRAELLQLPVGYDLVITVHEDVARAAHPELVEQTTRALRRALRQ